jgi:hypothetical protein
LARLEARAVFLGVAARFLLVALPFFLLVPVRFLLVAVRFLLAAVRFLLAAVRFAAARDAGFAAVLRVVERTEPFVFLRDAAAFNCFPLFGLWPRPRAGRPGTSRVRLTSNHSSRRACEGSNFFSFADPESWTHPSFKV